MRSDLSAAARARRLLPALAGTWCLLVAASRPTVPPTSSLAEVAMRGDLRSMRSMLGACVESKAPRGDVRASKTLNPACDVNAAMGDGMTALHWAAERGDSAMTALLLKTGAKLDATTKAGANTPLHVASRSGNASVVRALLKAGADANARTTGGASALHLAATAGNADAVEALIAAKANVNATEPEWGQTPLMFAAAGNRVGAVRALLKNGANPAIRTRTVDLTEQLAIEQNAAKKRNEALYALLPDRVKDSMKVAAEAAAKAAREARFAAAPNPAAAAAAAEAAAKAAAAPAAAQPGFRVTANNTPPVGSLTATQIQQALEVARIERAKGKPTGPTEAADTLDGQVFGFEGTVGSMGGMTALHHAVRQGNAAAAMALIDGGADINQRTASDSTTPLLMAALNGHYDLALQLVKKGADVKLASTINVTPLYATLNTYWAPRSRYPQPQSMQVQQTTHIELMEALITAGADVNAKLKKNPWYFAYNNCGNANCGLEFLDNSTPFWRAAYATDMEAMRLLQKHGADVNVAAFRSPAEQARRRFPGAGGPDGPGAAFNALPADIDSAAKAVPPGIGVLPIHCAAGVGYGNGFAGNSHRHAPDAWMQSMKYMVEELHMDVNARDNNGYTP
ncbi:MAG: ankyrin repeat domain-containing protein, partial [Gemmatimonadaceae bacterium]